MTGALYAVPMARQEPPKYQQIARDLRARMESGEFPPDSRLPSKAELMEHYDVALATVSSALAELRKAGLAETVQGSGTFARKPPAPAPSQYDVLMGRIDELGEEIRRLKGRMTAAERALREEPE